MSELPVVLVVDDEVRSLESIRRILSDEFEVLTASETDTALRHFQNAEIEVNDPMRPAHAGPVRN